MKTLKTLKAQLLKDPQTQRDYEALSEEFAVAREMIAARARAGLTQADVAARMGTTQSAVARIESGKRRPSLSTVERYAHAVGCKAVVRLEAR